LIYPHQAPCYSSISNPIIKGEDLKAGKILEGITTETLKLYADEFKKRFQQFYDQAQKSVTSQ
jgi:hypothetical protein